MLDEMIKALAPWPFFQVMLGAFILGTGVWAIIKGAKRGSRETTEDQRHFLEDQRSLWRAYEQLEHMEENSYKTVAILEKILDRLNNNAEAMRVLAQQINNNAEATKALASQVYNMWGGPGPTRP